MALPIAVVSGILNILVYWGHRGIAQAMYLATSLYLRPGELQQLTCGQLTPPTSGAGTVCWSVTMHPREARVASKTHELDDGLLLDGPDQKLLSTLAILLTQGRRGTELLMPIEKSCTPSCSGRPPITSRSQSCMQYPTNFATAVPLTT